MKAFKVVIGLRQKVSLPAGEPVSYVCLLLSHVTSVSERDRLSAEEQDLNLSQAASTSLSLSPLSFEKVPHTPLHFKPALSALNLSLNTEVFH